MERKDITSVVVAPKSVRGLNNSRFPERVGRTRPDPLEIATTIDGQGKPVVDRVDLASVINMDGGA